MDPIAATNGLDPVRRLKGMSHVCAGITIGE